MNFIIKKNLLFLVSFLFIGTTFAIPVSPFIPFFASVPWILFLFINVFLDVIFFLNRKLPILYVFFLISFLLLYFFYSFLVKDFFIFFSEQLSFLSFDINLYILIIFVICIDILIIFGFKIGFKGWLKYLGFFFIIPNLLLFWQLFFLNKTIYTYTKIEDNIISSLDKYMGLDVDYLRKSINSSYNSIDIKFNGNKKRTEDIFCRYTISKYRNANYLNDHILLSVGVARYWKKCNWIYKNIKEHVLDEESFKNNYIIDNKKNEEIYGKDCNDRKCLDKRLKEEIIIKEKGLKSCEQFSSLSMVNECKYDYLIYYALENANIRICNKIDSENKKKKCIETYVKGMIDKESCLKINNSELRNVCNDFFWLAKSRKIKSPDLCNKIKEAYIYNKCKDRFQFN